jgi:DNA repair exonuclease SbcCD ATPase subunit
MIIKSIKLKNFQCYENFKALFAPMTFIKGKNGAGKTTLGMDAILFAIYGYCKKNLAELPMRDKAKSCTVIVEVEKDGHIYTIDRSYPTKLNVLKDGEPLNLNTSADYQRYLNKLFCDANYFKKFRMIDSDIGVNFLEEGQQALKKILFSVSDDVFNKVKDNLNSIKRDREIYNKDKAVIYPYYPSEDRLKILKEEANKYREQLNQLEKEERELHREQLSGNNEKGRYQGQLQTAKRNKDLTEKNTHCYACKQALEQKTKERMLKVKIAEIEKLEKALKNVNSMMEEINEIAEQNKPTVTKLKSHYEKINTLKTKLEGRLKQKDYKYTQKDIEIVKQALKELDNLSTRYLTQSLAILEPIINSVLEKINFNVHFEMNDKGKLNITLTKEDIKYNYKDLSTGQKLLLQIAFKIALLLEKSEEGIIIADEGLSSLDEENLIHVLTIFESYPFQLVFILHGFENVPGGVKVIDLNIGER